MFKSSTSEQEHAIKSRFASGGKFTSEQLDAGDDLKAQEAAAAASSSSGFDPNDNRSLYERLQANKDAKQEEFDHNNSFKNQMDHWKLDEDEAAFEEERQLKLRQQQQEAKEHERPSDVPPAPPNSLPAPAILPPPRLPQPAIRAEVGGGQSRLAAASLAVVALTDVIRI